MAEECDFKVPTRMPPTVHHTKKTLHPTSYILHSTPYILEGCMQHKDAERVEELTDDQVLCHEHPTTYTLDRTCFSNFAFICDAACFTRFSSASTARRKA